MDAIASALRASSSGPIDLVEELEPLLLLEPAQEPEGDALLVAELVERDAEELGRAVDDQRPDLAVEDSQVQPVEQDAGPARVVDQELAVLEVAGQILDGRVEVAVPAVVLDGVVPEAEGVDGLQGPVLVGHALRSRRATRTAAAARAARCDRGADGAVDAQQLGDGGGRPPAPAALGGDAEAGDEARGRRSMRRRVPSTPSVWWTRPEVELGLGAQAELPQRRVVRLVEALARDGQVDPVERAAEARAPARWRRRPASPASAGSLKWRCWTSP